MALCISDVFPSPFEGARVVVNKGLSNHFQISHSLQLTSGTSSGYRFGATYVGTHQVSPTEAYPVLLGDIDPNGNLNANVLLQAAENCRFKFQAQVVISFANVRVWLKIWGSSTFSYYYSLKTVNFNWLSIAWITKEVIIQPRWCVPIRMCWMELVHFVYILIVIFISLIFSCKLYLSYHLRSLRRSLFAVCYEKLGFRGRIDLSKNGCSAWWPNSIYFPRC